MPEPIEPDAAGLVPWHDGASATAAWGDAVAVPELAILLAMTRGACWGFVPRSTRAAIVGVDDAGLPRDPDVVPDLVPVRFRVGQLMHLQSIVQAAKTNRNDDSIGLDGYAVRVYVFGAEVRKVLVPPAYGDGSSVF